jgi:hypothetical protein
MLSKLPKLSRIRTINKMPKVICYAATIFGNFCTSSPLGMSGSTMKQSDQSDRCNAGGDCTGSSNTTQLL